MKTIAEKCKTGLIVLIALFQGTFVSLAPLAIYAQEVPPEEPVVIETPPPQTETPQPVTPGPQEPTGPENTTYSYNEVTGLWENQYYTWDPVTKLTSPKTEQYYSYNPETDHWDTTAWIYSPETGSYTPQIVSVTQPPQSSQQPGSNPEGQSDHALPSGGAIGAPSISLSDEFASSSAPLTISDVENPGPGSLSVITYDSDSSGYFDNFFNANISTSVNANSTSGDASVVQNTFGGNATSGEALAMANIMNIVQSVWGVGGILPNFYTATLQGDYFGDIMIDPGALSSQVASSNQDNLVINTVNDIGVEVNVDLLAGSGDATVSKNTRGGDATTGDATAVATIVNMINTSLAAQQSFLGILNINGDFTGDVLLPYDLQEQLAAANIPSMNISFENDESTSYTAHTTNNQTIDNNITTTASSGSALVGNNTRGGNATSGNATTDVTVYNLTGQTIVAENAMLVFVNVMGEWVGLITNAPSNARSALLMSGLESGSNQYTACGCASNTEITTENSALIRNNINVGAHTGDAEVSYNTTGGNATSGDAYASASVVNMTYNTMSFGGWFGMLFINIFGDWHGSFGTDTAYGDTPPVGGGNSSPKPTTNTTTSGSAAPGAAIVTNRLSRGLNRASSVGAQSQESTPIVLANSDGSGPTTVGSTTPSISAASSTTNWLVWWFVGTVIALLLARRYASAPTTN